MKIKEFILENEVEVKNWLIDEFDEDEFEEIKFVDGAYFNDKNELIETDEICNIEGFGCDFSFNRKFVKSEYEDNREDKIIINNKKVYILLYNI